MDAEETEYLNRLIQEYKKEQLHKIAPELENILRECIEEVVYKGYPNPVQWDRQYRLLNHIVTVDEDDGKIFIHENLLGAGYFSAVDGSNQDANLDKFIFEGHRDNKGSGMFHQYPYAENPSFQPGEVFRLAKQRIKEKYPELEIEIVLSTDE